MNRSEHRRYRNTVTAWVDCELDAVAAMSTAAHLRECWDCSSGAKIAKLAEHSLRRYAARLGSA